MVTVSMEAVLPRSAPMRRYVLSLCDHTHTLTIQDSEAETPEIYCKSFYLQLYLQAKGKS